MKHDRIALMPDWPARMGEDLAALYLGISTGTLRERFADTWTLRRALQRTAWALGWPLDPQEQRKAA